MIKSLLPIILISFCCIAQAITTNKAPIQIVSDKANFDNKKGVATYYGKVIITQGENILHADKLIVQSNHSKQISTMTATGNPANFHSVKDDSKPNGNAKTIIYYPQSDIVELIGNANLTQNQDTIHGPKLVYNLSTEELQSDSSKTQRSTVIINSKRVP